MSTSKRKTRSAAQATDESKEIVPSVDSSTTNGKRESESKQGCSVVLYHNPSCSKSREAKAFLESQEIEFTVKLYKEAGLTVNEVLELMDLVGGKPAAFVRTTDPPYREEPFDLTDKRLVAEKLAANPALLQRPIVVVNKAKAAIGRPTLQPIQDLFKA